jgi:hypothetical protein
MKGHPLHVTILEEPGARRCEGQCGVDWSSEESQDAARQALRARFGDSVDLEFFALEQSSPPPTMASLVERVRAENLPLPLLAVDGQPRIWGDFDIRMMFTVVDAEMETRNG